MGIDAFFCFVALHGIHLSEELVVGKFPFDNGGLFRDIDNDSVAEFNPESFPSGFVEKYEAVLINSCSIHGFSLLLILAWTNGFVNNQWLIHLALVENVVGEAMHETTHDVENKEADGEHNHEDDETVLSKENKFEEVANERNGEGGNHDTDDGKEETSTEFVEWSRDPIDENKVNSKGDEHRDGGKFGVRKALKMRDNGESRHTDRDGEADWKGVGEDVSSEAVFDAVGVVFERKDEAREADTGEV